jgi:hypothetical protein
MTDQAEMTITEKIAQFEGQGWRYLPDGQSWSGGVWLHDEHGCVNRGGGSFGWIDQAVERLETFLANLERCK